MLTDLLKAIRAGYREARTTYRRRRWLRQYATSFDCTTPF